MKRYYNIFMLVLFSATLWSCKVDEFQPEPIGEAVPYEPEELPLLDEVLQESGHNLFWKAWDNSTLNDSLDTWEHSPLILLVPSDEAFKTAGYTLEVINATPSRELDKLLLYFCLELNVDTLKNEYTAGNVKVRTKLKHPMMRIGTSPFVYSHHLGISGGRLFVNGTNTGVYTLKRVQKADLLYTEHFFRRPEKDMWTYLKEDGRFTQFIKILESQDGSYGSKIPRFKMQPKLSVDYTLSTMLSFSSIFAPTDEAFQHADSKYNSAAKLNRLNSAYSSKIATQYYVPYAFYHFLRSDSIISYHSCWGMRYMPEQGLEPAAKRNPIVFFSNDLTNEFLGNYVLQPTGWRPIDHPQMYVPFIFGKDEKGRVTIRLKNALEGTEPATIIEPDVMTFSGPIHVVDRLFVPENF